MTKALTWNELATAYDRMTGRHARCVPLQTIYKWAIRQSCFVIGKDGSIRWKHKVKTSQRTAQKTTVQISDDIKARWRRTRPRYTIPYRQTRVMETDYDDEDWYFSAMGMECFDD